MMHGWSCVPSNYRTGTLTRSKKLHRSETNRRKHRLPTALECGNRNGQPQWVVSFRAHVYMISETCFAQMGTGAVVMPCTVDMVKALDGKTDVDRVDKALLPRLVTKFDLRNKKAVIRTNKLKPRPLPASLSVIYTNECVIPSRQM